MTAEPASAAAAQATIRKLHHDDIAALQAIDRRAHGEAWSYASFADQIADPQFVHLVAERRGRVVAHAASWLDGSTLRVTNVATDPDSIGHGLASRLLLDLLAPSSECVTAVFNAAELEVRPANRRAQRLYGRFGFAPVGISRGFYDRRDVSGSTDALIMRVPDTSSPAWAERLQLIRHDLTTRDEGAAA